MLRIRHLFLETIALLLTLSGTELAVGATATAIVTVTILAPVSQTDPLLLSTLELDMRGKMSDEITVTNRSDDWKELRITLSPQSVSPSNCQLHYSPTSVSIPPGGAQVVRLLIVSDRTESCAMEHHLEIADASTPLLPLFNVPVYTGHF